MVLVFLSSAIGSPTANVVPLFGILSGFAHIASLHGPCVREHAFWLLL